MKSIAIFLACIFALLSNAYAQSNGLKPYQKGDWKAITKPYAGQPLVIHFWGVTCSPCAREMPLWGKFIAQHKNAKIIFVQVDDVSTESAANMLASAQLKDANTYMLTSPFDDAMRYEVDPKWRGETPMTLLIDKNGKVIRKIGSIDFDQLNQWYLRGT